MTDVTVTYLAQLYSTEAYSPGADVANLPDVVSASGATGSIIEGIGFLIVVAILARYIAPFVGRAMKARQEAIAKQLADAESAGMKLAESQAAYDAAVLQAQAEAEELIAEARAQHATIVAEATSAARARAEEITARARESLEAERMQAIKSLQAEIAALAVGQAEQTVLASLTDDARQRRVVDRFLIELESGQVRGEAATSTPGSSTGGRSA